MAELVDYSRRRQGHRMRLVVPADPVEGHHMVVGVEERHMVGSMHFAVVVEGTHRAEVRRKVVAEGMDSAKAGIVDKVAGKAVGQSGKRPA